MEDYIPRAEPELTIWLQNYKTKLPNYGETLGLTGDNVTDQQNAATDVIEKINEVAQAKSSFKNLVDAKDVFKDQRIKSIRNTANSMKANSNYTEAIGKNLGIFGEGADMDENAIKPKIKAEAGTDGVKVSFTKKGLTGVRVFSRLKGTAAWIYLGTDLYSPYLDSRPVTNSQPETREYMVHGFIGDDEVGQSSDIVSVVFEGVLV